jgi:hypothetical protein
MELSFFDVADDLMHSLAKVIGGEGALQVYNKICGEAYNYHGDRKEFIVNEMLRVRKEKAWKDYTKKIATDLYIYYIIENLINIGSLSEPFSEKDINSVSNALFDKTSFLSKHSVGKASKEKEYFIKIGHNSYEINKEWLTT